MNVRTAFVRRQLALGVALLGCPLTAATVAQGAIVSIDVSTFSDVNAGMTHGQSKRTISSFVPGGNLEIYFDNDYIGLSADNAGSIFQFAIDGADASPRNFGANADISAWVGAWTGGVNKTAFYYNGYLPSPNFGPGSFMGFRRGDGTNWIYGWIEVTWYWTGDPQTSMFQILGAAYESEVNAAIFTPLAPPAIPLPGAAGLAACGLLWACADVGGAERLRLTTTTRQRSRTDPVPARGPGRSLGWPRAVAASWAPHRPGKAHSSRRNRARP